MARTLRSGDFTAALVGLSGRLLSFFLILAIPLAPKAASALDASPPLAFELLSPPNGGWGSPTPTLSWESSGDPESAIDHYELVVDGVLVNSSVETTQYTIPAGTALPVGIHWWMVRAVNGEGLTTDSSSTFTIQVESTPPAAFDLLTPEDGTWFTAETFALSWEGTEDAASGMDHYRVLLDGLPVATTTAGVTQIDDLEPSSQVQYWTADFDDSSFQGFIVEGDGGDARWHVSSSRSVSSPSSLRFGRLDAPSYDTGLPTWGTAQSPTVTLPRTPSLTLEFELFADLRSSSSADLFQVFIIEEAAQDTLVDKSILVLGPSWQTVTVDLTPWAGRQVSLLFSFDSLIPAVAGNEGLYVDDIRLTAVTPSLGRFREGFESGLASWTTAGTWGLEQTAHTGTWGLAESPLTNYGNSWKIAALWNRTFAIGQSTDPVFSFWIRGDVENARDGVSLQSSIDGGATWQRLGAQWTSDFASWTRVERSLSELVGKNNVRFRFYFESDGSVVAPGFVIDDLLLDSGKVTLSEGEHQWQVQAVDLAGNAQASLSTGVFYFDAGPPSPFSGTAPAAAAWTADNTPLYQWTASTDAGAGLDRYELVVDGVTVLDAIEPNALSFDSASLPPLVDGTHNWSLLAVDALGQSTATETLSFKVDATPPLPFATIAPANLGWVDTLTPTFSWNATTDAGIGLSHYNLYINGDLVQSQIHQTTTTLPPGLSLDSGENSWFVEACDSLAQCRTTSVATFYTDLEPPQAFDLVSPLSGSSARSSDLELCWEASGDASSGVAFYSVYFDGQEAFVIPATPGNTVCANLTQNLATSPVTLFEEDFGTPNGWQFDASWTQTDQQPCIGTWGMRSGLTYNLDSSLELLTPVDVLGYIDPRLEYTYRRDLGLGDKVSVEAVAHGDSQWTLLHQLTGGVWTDCKEEQAALALSSDSGMVRVRFTIHTDGLDLDSGFLLNRVVVSGSEYLSDGVHSWNVVATDLGGGTTASNEVWTVQVDDLPPLPFDLATPLENACLGTGLVSFNWNPTDDDTTGLAGYRLEVQSAGELRTWTLPSEASSYQLAEEEALDDGTSTWTVVAMDNLGNERPATQPGTLKVDLVPPDPFNLTLPADGALIAIPTPQFSWQQATDSGCGISHYRLEIDGVTARNNIPGLVATPSAGIAQGPHSWTVVAVDGLGRETAATPRQITLDWEPPTMPTPSTPTCGSEVLTTQPTLNWLASEDESGIDHYRLWMLSSDAQTILDVTLPGSQTSYTFQSDLPVGEYQWFVSATDETGKTSQDSSACTIVIRRCEPGTVEDCPAPPEAVGLCHPGVHQCLPEGAWSACLGTVLPQDELCDGLDNDCDNSTDEDWVELGQACSAGVGACSVWGIAQCTADGLGVLCNAQPADPTPEICDSVDNDCDGATDEEWTDLGIPCSAGIGGCIRQGHMVCSGDGTSLVCSAVAGTPVPELCDGIDNDCDSLLDESWPTLGGPCDVGTGACLAPGTIVCRSDGQGTTCEGEPAVPEAESCDSIDNDCDGTTDEDWPDVGKTCVEGQSACAVVGVLRCRVDGDGTFCDGEPGSPEDERCDGIDNDCDGFTDEEWATLGSPCDGPDNDLCAHGQRVCSADGTGTTCGEEDPSDIQETCDGIDNDCDGLTDEDQPEVGLTCTTGLGICKNTGTVSCNPTGDLVCSASAGTPDSEETCGNGVDDDCDGSVDQGCPCSLPGSSQACGAYLGICTTGVQFCALEGWSNCVGEDWIPGFVDECGNGLDDDCDGVIDEGCPCQAGSSQVCGTNAGICTEGTSSCVNGKWSSDCVGDLGEVTLPQIETCDGLDNNCNLLVDEYVCVCEPGQSRLCPDHTPCEIWEQTCTQEHQWTTCSYLGPDPDCQTEGSPEVAELDLDLQSEDRIEVGEDGMRQEVLFEDSASSPDQSETDNPENSSSGGCAASPGQQPHTNLLFLLWLLPLRLLRLRPAPRRRPHP